MAWKDLKLGKKLGVGFGFLIFVGLLLGLIGFRSLTKVNVVVEKADSANRLIKMAQQTRLAEKNYMRLKDQKTLEIQTGSVKEMQEHLAEMKKLFKRKEDLDHIQGVEEKLADYQDNFMSWIELGGKQNQAMASMRGDIEKLMKICEDVRLEQKKQLAEKQEEMNAFTADKLKKMLAAQEIFQIALNAKADRTVLMRADDKKVKAEWLEKNQQLFSKTSELKNLFKLQKNISQADGILTYYKDYESALLRYLKSKSNSDKNAMVEAAKKTVGEINAIVADQKAQYDSALIDGQKQIMDKIDKADDANRLIKNVLAARINLLYYVLTKDIKYSNNVDRTVEDCLSLAMEMKDRFNAEHNKAQMDSVMAACRAYSEEFAQWENYSSKQQENEAHMVQVARDLIEQCNEMRAGQKDIMKSTASSAKLTLILFILLGAIVGIIIAVIITKGIVGPIQKGVNFAQHVAQGDLTQELDVDQKDEVGILAQALTNMIIRIRQIVQDVQSAANNVASGSQELSSTSQEMSQGASEQAASAEEVSSSMEEMSANIRQNADNAMQTEKISLKASTEIDDGNQAVSDTVTAMKDIADKISIIEEIARQTNLLALNAAIEAARAGEHGKGFAVVASEVRKLAERSQVAAAEISQLSSSSVQVAENAGKMLTQIVPEIGRTAELVQEISAASNEQNSGAEQINSAIQQLNEVIQQNAAASEEMASTSEELSSQAEQLLDTISFFRLAQGAQRRSTRPSPTVTATSKKKTVVRSVAPPSAPKKQVEASSSASSGGFELELNDGGDQLDDDFEKF